MHVRCVLFVLSTINIPDCWFNIPPVEWYLENYIVNVLYCIALYQNRVFTICTQATDRTFPLCLGRHPAQSAPIEGEECGKDHNAEHVGGYTDNNNALASLLQQLKSGEQQRDPRQ